MSQTMNFVNEFTDAASVTIVQLCQLFVQSLGIGCREEEVYQDKTR